MPRNVQSAVWVVRIAWEKMSLTSPFCGIVTMREDFLYVHISNTYTCKYVAKYLTVRQNAVLSLGLHCLWSLGRACTDTLGGVNCVLGCPLFPSLGIYRTANNNCKATPKSSHRENLVFLKTSQIY